MYICDAFEKEVCSKCKDNSLCRKDIFQMQSCATLEIWRLLMKKQ